MRSMSLLLGFSIVILAALFFGSLGKDRSVQKTAEPGIEKKVSRNDSRGTVVKQPATETE